RTSTPRSASRRPDRAARRSGCSSSSFATPLPTVPQPIRAMPSGSSISSRLGRAEPPDTCSFSINQDIRAQVNVARPHDCAVIDTHLGENSRVGTNFIEYRANEIFANIAFHDFSAEESQSQPKSTSWHRTYTPNRGHYTI